MPALARFARYLLDQHLDAFCETQLALGYELEIPLLKYFEGLPSNEQLQLVRHSAEELLTALASNQAAVHLEESTLRWKTNHLQLVDRNAVATTDITLINHLQKKSLLHFVPAYTTDVDTVLTLVDEIDTYLLAAITAYTHTYIGLLKERIEEHTHFIQKVAGTIPGAVYVFELQPFRCIYANNNLPAIIGYNQEELNSLGREGIWQRIHPDDQPALLQQMTALENAGDGEIFLFKCRIQNNQGEYKWLANYTAVFRRKEDGSPAEIIGITLDFSNEQKMTAENQRLIKVLSRSEALYKKAEEIANMGNWAWYMKKNRLDWTDQLYRIYGLEPQSEIMTIERFLSFVHPDDRDYVQAGVDELTKESRVDYTFRIITPDGTEKWLRSRAHIIKDKEGNVSTILGIEQDVTEKQKLIARMEESQRLYKQAQAMSKVGNFSWDMQTGAIFWSDEVYKIYERPFGEAIRFEEAFTPIVEEDRPRVEAAVQQVIEQKKGLSISYAIRRKDGGTKYVTLHTNVQLHRDGSIAYIMGTFQDVTEKEELIQRLRQSERLYKQAQNLAHLGNWSFDLENGQITWSEELYAIYEREKFEPVTREVWNNYIAPEDQNRIEAHLQQVITGQTPLDILHPITLPSGHTKVLHRRGEVIVNEAGKPVRLVGTTQDITEHVQMQAELRDSQNFIQKITDATPSIIVTYNVQTGRYTFVSEGIKKLLGYKTAEVLEKGTEFFSSIMQPDDLQEIEQKLSQALEIANRDPERTDLVIEYTHRVRHKNGTLRWLHTYSTIFDYNSKGQVEHVLNISLDVTDQMQASEKIQEQEHFIQQIADASPTILYLFDVPTQRFAYINREAFFVLGYLPDEILEEGANITDFLYHPEDMALLPCRRQSSKTFQQLDSMIQYECRMQHKDGDYRWLLVREIVFKTDDEGQITQIIGAALDINRRKEMERTILQNTLQLEQSNASLEEFAYVASHDLKEPLRKISTFGDRLMASQLDRLSDDGKIYLRKIVDASQRMQNMISDLLSISMISGNHAFETSSLQDILEEAIQTLEFKIENQRAVVRYEALPEARVIPSQFRQLFQNLLSNSLKFVREEVPPVITITCEEASAYEVAPYQLASAERYIKILLTDNGIGFENEYAQKIFSIFQRLHGRSEYEGSGIGLAICKKIVEHHGGAIFAAGDPSQGATFTILLPA